MANPACVAVGINQYQFFQPLGYAQADARALRLFLVEHAGWSPDRCLLLSETSPPVGNRSTIPTRETIINWVDYFVKEQVQPGDLLWFFFSGYGVNIHGEDYLMPLEGNPNDIGTGISVRSLFERLKNRGDAPLLVLLDINRSSGQDSDRVGYQTVELATQLGIPTILSAQLDEFSCESSELSHGIFTAGLLEVLRYAPEMTVAALEKYLRDRVPELSKQFELPVQVPLTVLPSPEAGSQLIWLKEASRQPSRDVFDAAILPDMSDKPVPPTVLQDSSRVALNTTGVETNSKQAALVALGFKNSNSTGNDQATWWQNLLFWGSGIALIVLMIAGVLLRNRDAFSGQQALQTSANAIAPRSAAKSQKPTRNSNLKTQTPKLSKPTQSKKETSQDVLDRARTLIVPNQASHFSQAITEASKIPLGDPLYKQAQQDIARWSGVIVDLAKGRAEQGDFAGAIAAAQLVPSDQPLYAESQKAIARWKELARQQQTNRVLLQAAKALIDPNQASSYNKAITAVSKVPPGQPGYADAQKLTAQWSRTIYQIAEIRASKGNFQEAIATANLVPESTPTYEAAQKAIAKWKAGKK